MVEPNRRDFVRAVRDLAGRVGAGLELDAPPIPSARRAALLHGTLILSRHELRSDHGAQARDDLLNQRGYLATAIETETPGGELKRWVVRKGHQTLSKTVGDPWTAHVGKLASPGVRKP